jgi:hypothetical protein
MARLHEAKLAGLVYMALIINKRRNEKIKFWIMLREEMGKENIGLSLKLNMNTTFKTIRVRQSAGSRM